MPYPRPRPDEKEDQFVSRCMSDEVMKKEITDTKKRAAICYVIYEKRKKS